MVVVAPQHRREGIGSALVAHVTAGSPEVTWALRAGREGAAEFFSESSTSGPRPFLGNAFAG